MAIYHLSAKIISRAAGRSVVAAAAYRSGESIEDESSGLVHDYTRKRGIEDKAILAPEGAARWVFDRARLWNQVQAGERRRDAQLAREIEIGLPVELDAQQQGVLLRQYVRREFVAQGMVADLAIHRDDPHNPHAHVLLTLRRLDGEGFGPKQRGWNDKRQLLRWRAAWEELTNEHLARAGLAVRIDHRSLKEQGLELEPGRKIGVSLERQQAGRLPWRIADRVEEQRRIAHENGERIRQHPQLALQALTHQRATFTAQDLARFLHTRTDGAEQFRWAQLRVLASRELVTLGRDEQGRVRYTSREMLQIERALLERAESMDRRRAHGVRATHQRSVLSQHRLTGEQRVALEALTGEGDLKALVGVAGSGKSRLLAAAREAWEAEGYRVKGAALSGIAAENLTAAAGIDSRTIASFEWAWRQGREVLSRNDVLVIDEAGMIGTRQLARVLEAAASAQAKVVLVGDPEQLQAIEAGAAFRGVLAQSGVAQLSEVRRQRQGWQREATRRFAQTHTAAGLELYDAHGRVREFTSREAACRAPLADWSRERELAPAASRLILAYTRADVRALNEQARALRSQRGELGPAQRIETTRGAREFAVNDRLYFLRNEKSLGVRNGTLGTVEAIGGGVVQVRLDGEAQRRVVVDTRFYQDLEHGYAATVYKAQGVTVDHTYVLATAHFDRHATYVALSRHRAAASVFYAKEDFAARGATDGLSAEQARRHLYEALSRARPKELVHDYLERDAEPLARRPGKEIAPMADIEQRQVRAARDWRASARPNVAAEGIDVLYRPPRLERGHEHGGAEEALTP